MVSGSVRLKINLRKCEIFPITEMNDIRSLTWVLNCRVRALPATYHGAPKKDHIVWSLVIQEGQEETSMAEKKFV